ncbi:MAG: hypothetical protein VZR53_19525 [Prevotella sp.]|nr:hypothetical protein [Prevotella sp.]
MPRQERTKSGTGIYHVMLRGINRQEIWGRFGTQGDSPRVSINADGSGHDGPKPNLTKKEIGFISKIRGFFNIK